MGSNESPVRRKLESFENFRDKEQVYSAIQAAILFIEHTHPQNEIISTLWNASAHREGELKDHYNSQLYRERT